MSFTVVFKELNSNMPTHHAVHHGGGGKRQRHGMEGKGMAGKVIQE